MLWVFDSGLGWLQTLKYLQKEFSEFDYIFFADNKNVPYWNKSPEEIKKLTFDWLNFLFDKWAKLVILACNTASAYAIRSWQQTYPNKKVLSVTIPWVEAIIEWWHQKIWIFATQATVNSNIYPKKYEEVKGYVDIEFHQVACHNLVEIIENWINDEKIIYENIGLYLNQLPKDIDWLVLWCTHYPILLDYIEKVYNKKIIDPSMEAVKKLKEYFKKHTKIYNSISKNWKTQIFSSGKDIII